MKAALGKKPMNKKYIDILFIMLIFAGLLRLAIGIGYYNPQDTLWYKTWVIGLNEGLFDIYSRADSLSLDYPPIYLVFLRLLGFIYEATGEEVHQYTDMFVMKLWPMVGDIICGWALFAVFKKQSPKLGLIAAALWLFNPSAIFNSSFWGQTDPIMCVLLLISFMALEKEKPILASVLFAIAGMTKFQCLFFTPVFLMELFVRFRVKKFFGGILAAAGTVAAVFIPFMIGSKNIMLFFDVYLKGQGLYPYCTLNAFNIYGIFGLNWKEDTGGIISLYSISFLLVVVLIIGLILVYLFARRKSVWILGFLFMNTLFMFMTRMHERYQFVVLIFILMAALTHKNRGMFYCFAGMTFMTFINQVIPMFGWRSTDSVFSTYYGNLMIFFSVLNLILFIVSTVYCIRYMFATCVDDETDITFTKEEGLQ